MATAEMKVDGKDIPLNELMETMLINILLGYVKSAKEIPKDKKIIEIKIEL